MINNNLYEMIEIAKSQFKEDSKDLADALDLVSLALDGLYDNATIKIQNYMNNRNTVDVKPMLDFSQQILDLQNIVDECSEELSNNEDDIVNEIIEKTDKKELPNYEEYKVDSLIAHSIDEDFTNKKACGFLLFNVHYNANSMKDVLVKTCEILAKKNISILNNFVSDPTMKGRTNSYFQTEPVIINSDARNIKIPGTNVYVWTNQSCNQIRNLLRKVLRKYGYNRDVIKIYLRADYSPLHNALDENNYIENTDDTEIETEQKIGKLVKSTMRKLSDSNYKFTANEILAMQSSKFCKETFGVYSPLIKKYDASCDITQQITVNGYTRYYKEIFIFNGEKYFVTSQWYEYNRDKFVKWRNILRVDIDKI